MNSAKIKKNTPTVQEQKEALGEKLMALKDSVTRKMIDSASARANTSSDTTKRYLKGNVADLTRGQQLYKELLKEIEKNAVAA